MKKISQFYKDTLKIQKIQNIGLINEIANLKDQLTITARKQERALDNRLTSLIVGQILRKLNRESAMEKKVKDLKDRMTGVELNLKLILQNQITQLTLLQQILDTHSSNSTLKFDDNKKGKRIRMNQQLIFVACQQIIPAPEPKKRKTRPSL